MLLRSLLMPALSGVWIFCLVTPGHATAPTSRPAAKAPVARSANSASKAPPPRTTASIKEDFLTRYAKTYRFRLGRPSSFTFAPDGQTLFFLRSGPRSFVRNLYAVDLKTGRERVLLTAQTLLAGVQEKLSAAEKARRERMRLAARGLVSYRLTKDGKQMLLPLSGKLYLYELATQKVREYKSAHGYPIDPRLSPDGRWIAAVRNGDLYLTDVASGKERRLTTKPHKAISHGTAEFVAQEEMGRMRGYWWSPDSQSILYQQTDERNVELIYLPNAANPGRKPYSQRYPRPGKTNAIVRLGLLSLKDGKTQWLRWGAKAFPYLNLVQWTKQGPLTILIQDRAQQHAQLWQVNPKDLSMRLLLEERDSAWLNIDQSVPRWLPKGQGFLWSSERKGAWQLELRDATGKFVRALTPTSLGYHRVLAVDNKRECVYISASPESTESHVYRVSLKAGASAPQRISPATGTHYASFGHGSAANLFVLSSATTQQYRQYNVFRFSNQTTQRLASVRDMSEDPKMDTHVQMLQVTPRKFRAAVVRPQDFQPKRRYPTILYVYAGPGYGMVGQDRGRYLFPQWIANQGFLVVLLDGRGTPGRGRAWERAIKGDFISVPLQDQVDGLLAVAKQVPQIDLKRVGVYGWSFGGYFSAMATLRRPDIFRAGVAGAPVTDWLDYDTHYTERYLGIPPAASQAYHRSNAASDASKLTRPLLLIHGTADDNVFFLHSLKLSHALLLANKPHDFLPLSNMTHMVRRADALLALNARLIRFFRHHLSAPRKR